MIKLKGNLVDISKNLLTRRFRLTFEVEYDASHILEPVKDKLLCIGVSQWKNKRSLDANAYYWQLITQLSDKLRYSKPYIHNLMLRRYGRPMVINDTMVYIVLPDSEEGMRLAEEAETFHIKPTSEIKEGKNGAYRTYIMLRGSSTYDTKEMSVLIDGLVQDCKEQGINTLPPEEFDRMMQTYDQSWRKKNEVNHTE